MANIKLHGDGGSSATYVPNVFIDEYMTTANGEFVKIYLYLLRCMNASNQSFSISEMADRFEHTEKDIQRALKYWEKMNLLRLEYDTKKELSGICLVDSKRIQPSAEDSSPTESESNAAASVPTDTAVSANSSVSAEHETVSDNSADSDTKSAEKINQRLTDSDAKKSSYTLDDLQSFQDNPALQEILFIAEQYLGRTLTSTDMRTIFYWYDVLHFSTDIIEYLIEYCIGNNHTSLRYMEKVALSWAEQDIQTVAEAKLASSSHKQSHFSVMKAFGITGRNLIESEITYVDKWTNEFAFSMDIISEACRRTIQSTQKPSFEYADTILNNWHKKDVHHLSDIVKLDSAFKKNKTANAKPNAAASPNRFNNFPQRSYNYDQLEQKLLNNNRK